MTTHPFPLSVIIPVYRQTAFTIQCVRRLWQTTESPRDMRVYVVDNGSNTGDPKEREDVPALLAPAIHQLGNPAALENTFVIPMGQNAGFAAAVNRGMREAPIGDNLFILNNDVLLDPGWCSGIRRTMEDHAGHKIGVVGAKLRFPSGIIQHAGASLGMFGSGVHMGGDYDHGQFDRYVECEYVAFAAAYIPCEAFNDVGYMDDSYFLYYEDADLCQSMWRRGYKVIYSPHIHGLHYHNVSGKKLGGANAKYEVESKERFFKKWQQGGAAN